MALPPNYYGFICKVRPFPVEKEEQVAADLLSGTNPPQTIYRLDDYDRRFFSMESTDDH